MLYEARKQVGGLDGNGLQKSLKRYAIKMAPGALGALGLMVETGPLMLPHEDARQRVIFSL